MTKVVLDASALIAYIRKEPGAENVLDLLPHAVMSSVNYAEVVTVLSRLTMTSDIIESILKNLIGHVMPFDQSQALITGVLQRQTKSKGLSLGDRACIALGIHLQAPIYTADKIWVDLALEDADIRLIR